MLTGINLIETRDFASKYDKAEKKTIFKIGLLSSNVSSYIGSIFAKDTSSVEGFFEAVRFGLRGVENFKDSKGADIEFKKVSKSIGDNKYSIVSNDVIDIIPFEVIVELGTEILNGSKLSEQETKN